MKKSPLFSLFLLVTLACNAEVFVLDYASHLKEGIALKDRKDATNAYRVKIDVSQAKITFNISEVRINKQGIATTVRQINRVEVVPSEVSLTTSGEDYILLGDNVAIDKNEYSILTNVKNSDIFSLQLHGVFLYYITDGKQGFSRTTTAHDAVYDKLFKALKSLTWESERIFESTKHEIGDYVWYEVSLKNPSKHTCLNGAQDANGNIIIPFDDQIIWCWDEIIKGEHYALFSAKKKINGDWIAALYAPSGRKIIDFDDYNLYSGFFWSSKGTINGCADRYQEYKTIGNINLEEFKLSNYTKSSTFNFWDLFTP